VTRAETYCFNLLITLAGNANSSDHKANPVAMEANLSVEVSMIVLDTISLYVSSFKVSQFNCILLLMNSLVMIKRIALIHRKIYALLGNQVCDFEA
jgi:hypothetical protein